MLQSWHKGRKKFAAVFDFKNIYKKRYLPIYKSMIRFVFPLIEFYQS